MKNSLRAVILAILSIALPAAAQNTELALSAGGYIPANNPASPGNAFAVQGTFSYRIASLPFVGLYFDLPIAGTLDSKVTSTRQLLSTGTYSALFIAPGLKLKLAPGFPISPYLAGGIGWARFHKSAELASSSGSETTSTNVFDVGGGLDMKVAPYFSIRGEARDFYSGSARLTLSSLDEREHNVLVTVGLVFRF